MKDKIWLSPGGGKYGEELPSGELERSYVDKKLSAHSGLDILDHKDLSVTTEKIASSAVTAQKIQDSSVTNSKLSLNAVTTDKISNGAVTIEKLAAVVKDYFTKKSGDVINGVLEVISSLKARAHIEIGTGDTAPDKHLVLTKDNISVTNGDLTISAPSGVAFPDTVTFNSDVSIAENLTAPLISTSVISGDGDNLIIDKPTEVHHKVVIPDGDEGGYTLNLEYNKISALGKKLIIQAYQGLDINAGGMPIELQSEVYFNSPLYIDDVIRLGENGQVDSFLDISNSFNEKISITPTSISTNADELSISCGSWMNLNSNVNITGEVNFNSFIFFNNKVLGEILGTYPRRSLGSGDVWIDPNVKYAGGIITDLNINFNSMNYSDITNEYVFSFRSGTLPTTLSMPAEVTWANGIYPIIRTNRIYEISVLEGLGRWTEYYA